MRLLVLAAGKLSKGPEFDLAERYIKRIKPMLRGQGLTGFEVLEFPESKKDTASARKKEEADRLLKALPQDSFITVLDETGKNLTSLAIAGLVGKARDDGIKTFCFIIGGPDGLDDGVRDKAHLRLGFGGVTWPHQLVRAMAMEQVYRTLTLLAGHPYHRA